ncbi:hypothetical protein COO91_09807 (plasmid) [Nostoc flagelliforme CCNUN1]|uniref:Uncharacterized protein n=1 Tax=Nostoc flagelliforme CCNUN1 TaxID=2038116 RepID=A0A2K8T7F2_9NOSO|nr:hypothetical protein COO91_09807 [Nostoc flagelliforme CCNUN1]
MVLNTKDFILMTLDETIASQGFQVFEVFLAYRFPVLAQSSP